MQIIQLKAILRALLLGALAAFVPVTLSSCSKGGESAHTEHDGHDHDEKEGHSHDDGHDHDDDHDHSKH